MRLRRHTASILAFALLASLLLTASVASACPNCRDTVAEDAQTTSQANVAPEAPDARPHNVAAGPRLAEGFNYSVLLMLAVPYTLLGVFVIGGYYFMRKSRATMAAAAAIAHARAEAARTAGK